MAVLTRHARLLYLLALFQLLGGPLVLGGLLMVKRLMTEREMTLSQSVSHTLQHLDHLDAAGEGDLVLSNDSDFLPLTKPGAPMPKKVKDAKDKLWAVNDLTKFFWLSREPLPLIRLGWHDPVPRRLANVPPLPPPRWS